MEREGCGDRSGGREVLMDAVSARRAVLELSMGPGHSEVAAAKGLDNVTLILWSVPREENRGLMSHLGNPPTFRG